MDGLVDGQIYRWRWSDEARDDNSGRYGSYHCKSCIAVVHGGRLIDTYWSEMSSDRAIDPSKVELTYLCDQSWPQISEGRALCFDPADVVDTRHSNNSRAPIYLRPGAALSKEAILKTLADREESADSQIRVATWRKERVAELRKLVAEDRLSEVML